MAGELLLVGSLPCQTAEETFRIFASALGKWLACVPDGEVGTRRYWVDGMAYRVFTTHPDVETIKRPQPTKEGVEKWTPEGHQDEFGFRVKSGVSKVRFGDPGWRLGFARDAVNSHAILRLLKQAGVVPSHVKLQVCIPYAYSATRFFFPAEDRPKIIPGLVEAMRAEAAKIVELIPHEDLAIQWDLAVEQRAVDDRLAEGRDAAEQEAGDVLAGLTEICSAIPETVMLGYHMCFGTLAGWPTRQPQDLAGAVLLSNAAVNLSRRKVDYLNIPTLGSTADDFFRPLGELKAGAAQISMGCIHHLHGPGGMAAQMRAIKKFLPKFAISAPCGFGRAPDRPGKLLTDDGSRRGLTDYIDIILRDHKAAMALYEHIMR